MDSETAPESSCKTGILPNLKGQQADTGNYNTQEAAKSLKKSISLKLGTINQPSGSLYDGKQMWVQR